MPGPPHGCNYLSRAMKCVRECHTVATPKQHADVIACYDIEQALQRSALHLA